MEHNLIIEFTAWAQSNKGNLKLLREYLKGLLGDQKDLLVTTLNREQCLIEQGKAMMLQALIEKIEN